MHLANKYDRQQRVILGLVGCHKEFQLLLCQNFVHKNCNSLKLLSVVVKMKQILEGLLVCCMHLCII